MQPPVLKLLLGAAVVARAEESPRKINITSCNAYSSVERDFGFADADAVSAVVLDGDTSTLWSATFCDRYVCDLGDVYEVTEANFWQHSGTASWWGEGESAVFVGNSGDAFDYGDGPAACARFNGGFSENHLPAEAVVAVVAAVVATITAAGVDFHGAVVDGWIAMAKAQWDEAAGQTKESQASPKR